MNKKILYIIFSIISFFLGFIIFGVLSNFPTINKTFFEVKITDIFQILISSCLVFILTYFLNVKFYKSSKIDSILLNCIEKIENQISDSKSKGIEFTQTPSLVNKQSIRVLNKIMGRSMSLLLSIAADKPFNFEPEEIMNLQKSFFEFKQALDWDDFCNQTTDNPWKEMEDKICSKYCNLLSKLIKMKLSLFK